MRRSQDIGRLLVIAAAATLLTTIAGCVGDGQPAVGVAAPPPAGPKADDAGTTLTIQNPTDVKYYPSDEPLRLGQEYFNRGVYGVAQQYFQAAVEKAPTDASAWVGLAASYDHIGRFDMADRDYRQAIKLQGETPQILNNQGYSYMLRGNLNGAREKFHQALLQDPDDQSIQNNIALLNGSYRFIQRDSN